MGNSPSSSPLPPPTLVASEASSSRREADADLFEEFSTSTTFGEMTVHSTRSTAITNLTMSSRGSSAISYEEELRDQDDTYSSSTKIDSPMYQRRRQRLMSRGETSSRKLTSPDTHPFFSDALIELQDGGVAFNPQFGLDYMGEDGTRAVTARRRHRRHRRTQNSQNPNEAVDIDTAISGPHADASTETTNDAVVETDQQEENQEVDTDNNDQITLVEEQNQDEGVDEDEDDLDGNLGELKFVHPLASSLRATPAAFEAVRQKNNRRPRQNSFSAMGA